jgi:hypothetical protein
VTVHPVHTAVGELIRTRTMRIQVTADVQYTVRAPCLLQQLADAVAGGLETGGRGVPGSRPPIAVDAHDLWHHIAHNTHSWAIALGINRHRYLGPPSRGELGTPPVGQLLRACAAQAVSTAHEPIANAIHNAAARWHGQITTMLTGQAEQRGVRGAVCAQCGHITVVEQRDGEDYRVPAIALIVQDHDGAVLRWLACRACGWCATIGEDGSLVAVSLDTDPGQAA